MIVVQVLLVIARRVGARIWKGMAILVSRGGDGEDAVGGEVSEDGRGQRGSEHVGPVVV